ncbi:MAG TPA: hypothetical protein VF779_11115 [Pyrinomonadaceae bacterium]
MKRKLKQQMLTNRTKRSLRPNGTTAATMWQPSVRLHGVALCLGSLSPYSFNGDNNLQGQTESIQAAVIKDRRQMKS